MPDHRPAIRDSASAWFGLAAAWAVVIFLTVPYAPKITGTLAAWINERFAIDWGYALIGHVAAWGLGIVLAVAAWRMRSHPAWRSPLRVGIVVAVGVAYAVILSGMEIPAEKIHFLQYGLLAWLLRRAFAARTPSPAAWPLSFFCGASVGVLDEWFQHLTPGRHGESADMLWNVLAAALPLVLVAAFTPRRPGDDAGRALPPRDARLITATGLAFLLPLGWFLATVQQYGARIAVPVSGLEASAGYVFRTRLAGPEALRAAPPLAPATIAELARETPFSYSDFLARHPETAEPHLNEFRVHVYRRDRYLGMAGHELLRRKAAGVAETGERERDLARVFEVPESGRAVRAFAALSMDGWLRERHGSDLTAETVAEPLRSWIAGTDTGWGGRLWDAYLAEHARKAARGSREPGEIARTLAVAWHEHRILADWFPEYLDAAGLAWPAALEDAVWSAARGVEGEYESAVAARVLPRAVGFALAVMGGILAGFLLLGPRVFASSWVLAVGFLLAVVWVAGDRASIVDAGRTADAVAHRPVMRVRTPEADGGGRGAGDVDLAAAPAVRLVANATAGRGGDRAGSSTAVLAATRDALVVHFVVEDTDVVARVSDRDGELWRDDCVEVFLDTEGAGRRYVEIQVNPAGIVSDALVTWSLAIDFQAAARWDAANLAATTTRDSAGWSATVRIPWGDLGMAGPPAPGASFRANFCRVDRDRREPPVYRYEAWSATRGWFHRPLRFGIVEFVP